MERTIKQYVHCTVCGEFLMKCHGSCELEITCNKCDQDIVAVVKEGNVTVLENRREYM